MIDDLKIKLKPIVAQLFDFDNDIAVLENKITTLNDSIIGKDLEIKNIIDSDLSKANKLVELQKIIDAGGKGIKERNYLPEIFFESDSVYKFGFWLKTVQGDSYLEPIDAGGHLTLTSFLYHIINKANIKTTDDALTVFNKILGAQQLYTTYIFDQNQWGDSHGENWTPAVVVLNTTKDDCESLASLAVSAFEYYKLIENKFPEAYAFVGTGWYNWKSNNKGGHGFPCLYLKNGKSLNESLFIGESTLHSVRPVKALKDCKDMYEISWGCNSFWHDFRLKKENEWWSNSTAGPTQELKDEEKKKLIEDFWRV